MPNQPSSSHLPNQVPVKRVTDTVETQLDADTTQTEKIYLQRRATDNKKGFLHSLYCATFGAKNHIHSIGLILLFVLLLGGVLYFVFGIHFTSHNQGENGAYGIGISIGLFIQLLFLCLIFYLLLRRIIFYTIAQNTPFSGVSLQKKFARVFLLLSLPSIVFHLLAGSLVAHVLNSWSDGQHHEMLRSTTDLASVLDETQNMHLRDFAQIAIYNLPKNLSAYQSGEWATDIKRRSTIHGAYIYDAYGNMLHSWVGDAIAHKAWKQPAPRLFELSRIIHDNSQNVLSDPSAMLPTRGMLLPSQGVLWGELYQNRMVRHVLLSTVIEGTLLNVELIAIQPIQVAAALANLHEKRSTQWLLNGQFLYVIGAFFVAMVLVVMLFTSMTSGELARHMTLSIEQLNAYTQRIATGELGVQLQTKNLGALDQDSTLLIKNFNRMSSQLFEQHAQLTQTAKEIKDSHDQLEERNRLVELLLENVDAGILFVNAQGDVTTFNRKARNLLPNTQASGNPANPKAQTASAAQTLPKTLLEAMQTYQDQQTPSKPFTTNITIQEPHQPVHFLEVSLHTLKNETDAYGNLIILKDVAMLRRTQRALAWQAIARRMAHEIKNPLTPIQLSVQRLLRKYKGVGADQGQILEQSSQIILKQVHTLKHMVNEFSQFARLPEASLSVGNINHTLEEVIKLYAQALPPQAKLSTMLAPNLPRFLFDAEQIQRVLINLIDNALASISQKHENVTGDSPSLHITLSSQFEGQSNHVVVQVADNGPGIDAKVRKSIFEPYTTTKTTGTGLGLPIVLQIIEEHHGSIYVQDNVPQGAVFTIHLPVKANLSRQNAPLGVQTGPIQGQEQTRSPSREGGA